MNPNQIPELGRVLRVLGEHGDALGRDTPTDKLNEIRDDLRRALQLADEITGPKPRTRCKQHPFGAVDDDAPDLCLLCESRRRRARRDSDWIRPSH